MCDEMVTTRKDNETMRKRERVREMKETHTTDLEDLARHLHSKDGFQRGRPTHLQVPILGIRRGAAPPPFPVRSAQINNAFQSIAPLPLPTCSSQIGLSVLHERTAGSNTHVITSHCPSHTLQSPHSSRALSVLHVRTADEQQLLPAPLRCSWDECRPR